MAIGPGDTSLSTTRVWLGEYCIDMTAMSIKGETGCGETTYDSEPEGPLGENHYFLYPDSSKTQMSKVISFTCPAKEFRFSSDTSRLLNHMNAPNIIYNG
jgi:hypothetical protein